MSDILVPLAPELYGIVNPHALSLAPRARADNAENPRLSYSIHESSLSLSRQATLAFSLWTLAFRLIRAMAKTKKNPAAIALERLGGLKGGKDRLSPERCSWNMSHIRGKLLTPATW
jgi:hypothetical protein